VPTQRITIISGCIHPGIEFFVIFPSRLQKMEVSDYTSPGDATDDAHSNQAQSTCHRLDGHCLADFIFSNRLPISLVECTKFNKLIHCGRQIPPKYSPPYQKKWQDHLDNIYQSTYDEQMRLLPK
jgi:hypothetical protein